MRQQGEASVEEILESIKKVIARDNRAGAVIERRKREDEGLRTREPADTPSLQDENEDEVFDLGSAHLIEDEDEYPVDDDLLGSEDIERDRLDSDEDTPLIGDDVRDAMRENLAALAMLAKPGVPPQIVRSGETSLEGMVRDMLRPMLAEWLDAHLPGMVEKMVKDEISRIAGKRG